MTALEMYGALQNGTEQERKWAKDLQELGVTADALDQLWTNCHCRECWFRSLLAGLQVGEIEWSDLRLLSIYSYPLTPDFFSSLTHKVCEWLPDFQIQVA